MEQDFTKGLSVCIGNYGYYNEGYLHDTWIFSTSTACKIRCTRKSISLIMMASPSARPSSLPSFATNRAPHIALEAGYFSSAKA